MDRWMYASNSGQGFGKDLILHFWLHCAVAHKRGFGAEKLERNFERVLYGCGVNLRGKG